MKILHYGLAAISIFAAIGFCAADVFAQEPVKVGRGSYASTMPLSKGQTEEHDWTQGCDQSILMQTRKVWVTERPGQPIPTNDWWTGLISAPFADALWSYPAMVHPEASGVTVNYPTHWNENGSELKSSSWIKVTAQWFQAESAVAHTWHDWDVEMLMRNASGTAEMLTTLVHGSPFTWIETKGLGVLKLECSDTPQQFGDSGQATGLLIGDDCYGIYLPDGASATLSGRTLTVTGLDEEGSYVVIGLLTDEDDLEGYKEYAYAVPRNTMVTWSYDESRGEISSLWEVSATDLRTGADGAVLQGFLPHAYKSAVSKPQFNGTTYQTPRGKMKMTAGNSFQFTHKFAGMAPWYPMPTADNDAEHPFRAEVLKQLIQDYAQKGEFGADTYWGGKGLTQMALNMTFALESGDMETFESSRDKLKTVFKDWLTYTPGENDHYFAYYPRWGGLVGEATSYDSDTFNDHHFHYGYFTLAGALLCMVDDEFARDYGDMLRLLAKDYANWDRGDTRFPFLRTMDPWVGHSYAGGMGDNGNSNGNGQESTSESMQGWGGLYLLGVALNDKEIRDAGIFGWSNEARATREYWFDVDSRKPNPEFDPEGEGGHYDYSLYPHPYNSNITCKGIGWWTWFGGDPLFMHGIQWMPISPALDYLSWDRDFVQWAYDDLMNTPGWPHKWFEDDVDSGGNKLERLAANDWGNVTLSYMQRANPRLAASIFDEALARNEHIARSISTSHISYYTLHSHLTYGEIDLSCHADLPSAVVYVKEGQETYVVYNPGAEREVRFYRDGALIKTVKAPSRKLITVTEAPVATDMTLSAEPATRFPSTGRVSAHVTDQYGATADGATVSWSVSNPAVASIAADGQMTFASSVPTGATVTVTATAGNLSRTITLRKGEVPEVAQLRIVPSTTLVEKGNAVRYSAEMEDQYGEPYDGEIEWWINGEAADEPAISGEVAGKYRVKARCGVKEAEHELFVTPRMPDLARGKGATASSEENAGTVRGNLTDGDPGTRWGSRHRDGEWIYVDLGKECHITRVEPLWEAAYSSSYQIQTARDGAQHGVRTVEYADGNHDISVVAENEWVTVAEISGVSGAGLQSHSIEADGRYVRIKSLTRGTQYGISLYDLAICGYASDAEPTQLIGIEIGSEAAAVDEDKAMQFTATAYALNGTMLTTPVSWSTDNGNISDEGVLTPARYGKARVTATTPEGFSASREILVNEVLRLASLTLSADHLTIAIGDTDKITVEGTNQFRGIMDLEGQLETTVKDSDGNYSTGVVYDSSTGRVHGNMAGEYMLTFSCQGVEASASVSVVPLEDVNLALRKQVIYSSKENDGLQGGNAVDGNESTRWGSLFNDNEWWAVDLGSVYKLDRIRIVINDIAYASKALVEYSVDGENWQTLATLRRSSMGEETVNANDVTARYLRYTGRERSTNYGISLHEFEVYGNERLISGVAPQEEIRTDGNEPEVIYDLTGRRCKAPLAPGIYIKNGRKIAVR